MVAVKPVGTWKVRGLCFVGVFAFGVCAMAQGRAGGSAGGSPSLVEEATAVALDPQIVFERVVVGSDGSSRIAVDADGAAAGAGERIIYSNTLGVHAVNFPTNQPVSDDIATTAPNGCMLTRYRFKVLGKVLPTGAGGAYTVTYGLYTQCPLATGSNNATRDLVRIPGTEGVIAFPDDGPRLIEHVVIPAQSPVQIPTNVYLGIRFNRANCGAVVGAPAMVGFSGDIWDFPGFPCNGYLGGFPELPHASFWLEMFASDACPQAFVAYKAEKPSGGGTIMPNAEQGVDDLRLFVEDCRVTAYEVAVRGVGTYAFDLRRSCEGPPIAGTERNFVVNASTVPLLQIARFNFDPPIVLGTDKLYFGFKVQSTGSVVQAGILPVIGESTDEIYRVQDGVCHPVVPEPVVGSGIYGAVNLAITCAGELPTGACCDPYLTECAGGPDDGKRCLCNAVCVGGQDDGDCCSASSPCDSPGVCELVCPSPGTCEAVCRETTELNCPFPPQGSELRPEWESSAACDADPFGHNVCGAAACCHLRPNPVNPTILEPVCENLTKNECDAATPLDQPREWQLGQYCGLDAQRCPVDPCLVRDLPYCSGLEVPCPCYREVCEEDPFCCHVLWDTACCALIEEGCEGWLLGPDQCAPDHPVPGLTGAITVPVPGTMTTNNLHATTDKWEPGFCCNNGAGACVGGTNEGEPCIVNQDCADGQCSERIPDPGGQGLGTVWFKFVMPNGATSAGIHTCSSNAPALDSIMQVFKAIDHSSPIAECNSLVPIGCNDDYPNCSSTQRNSRLCLRDLTPGETYYIMLAAKTENRLGQYRVTISTSCSGITDSCGGCPAGEVAFVSPPSGAVDARIPNKLEAPNTPLGFRVFDAAGPAGVSPTCWSYCDSDHSSSIGIQGVQETSAGIYRIELSGPLPPGSAASIGYTNDDNQTTTARYFAHPGNVNGDTQSNSADILSLIDYLNGISTLPWGHHSGDLDRSGVIGPADIITLIDLLNGNGFAVWNGTLLPSAEGCP